MPSRARPHRPARWGVRDGAAGNRRNSCRVMRPFRRVNRQGARLSPAEDDHPRHERQCRSALGRAGRNRRQSRQLPAVLALARGGGTLVADPTSEKGDQGRHPGRAAWALRYVPDGRGRGPEDGSGACKFRIKGLVLGWSGRLGDRQPPPLGASDHRTQIRNVQHLA